MDFLKEFKELVFFKTKFPEQLFYDGLDYLDLFKISNFQLSYFRSSLGGALNKVSSENLLEREDDLNFFKLSAQASIGIEYFFGKLSVRAAYLYIQQLNNSYKEFEDYIHRENTQGGQLTLTYLLK